MNVNYFGTLEITKAFLPLLRKTGNTRILMNSSVAGIFADKFISAYSASKFALEGFSDSLRRELLPHDVYVSILQAGYIFTPLIQKQIPVGIEPYTQYEINKWTLFFKASLNGASPKVTSNAVIDVMRTCTKQSKPKPRYLVGGLAPIAWIFSKLPDTWSDYVMLNSPPETITDDDLKEINARSSMEYEL